MAKKKGKTINKDDYEVSSQTPAKRIAAPKLAYRPQRPKGFRLGIGLIGCGGITASHLTAYRRARYPVLALNDLDVERAEARRDEYYPKAKICRTAKEVLAHDGVDVVDIATHPAERVPLIAAAISAGKHVLSQKPFVTDLAAGKKLVAAAHKKGVRLAVNQNGRWAPHVSYARLAVAAGLLGEIKSVDTAIHFDHNWTAVTPFNKIRHLILYDFAIHWFDMVRCYMGTKEATSVYATTQATKTQRTRPPLLAQALVEFPNAQASLVFRGDTQYGSQDRTVIVGTKATLVSEGPNFNEQTIQIFSKKGIATPKLTGRWFDDGFDGTMSELLLAIQEKREPTNSAADNLHSLALCFAALASAETGRSVKPGAATKIHPQWLHV